MRTEVRAVAPTANPYVMYSIFKNRARMATRLRSDLRSAALSAGQHLYGSREFEKAEWTTTLLARLKARYAELKRAAADRVARAL